MVSVRRTRGGYRKYASAGLGRGFSLPVGLLLLALVTILVVASYKLSSSNLKVVYNIQVRDEAVAAAQSAVEQVISTDFTVPLKSNPRSTLASINVDIDGDGGRDYVVSFPSDVPRCIRRVLASGASPSEVELGGLFPSSGFWETDWEIEAVVTDATTGASARIREGVRLRQTETEANQVCPL